MIQSRALIPLALMVSFHQAVCKDRLCHFAEGSDHMLASLASPNDALAASEYSLVICFLVFC